MEFLCENLLTVQGYIFQIPVCRSQYTDINIACDFNDECSSVVATYDKNKIHTYIL